MKILFFLPAYLLGSIMLNAQPTVINNTRTVAHIPLPKNKISLVPPANYILFANDAGFFLNGSNPDKGDEQIKVSKLFLDFTFIKQGLIDSSTSHTDILINNYEGIWIKTKTTDGTNVFTSLILGFGNASYSYIIAAVFPSENAAIEAKLQKAIQSAYVDTFGYAGLLRTHTMSKSNDAARKTFQKRFDSKFHVDVSGSGFIPAEIISDDHIIYTMDGAYPPVTPDESKIDVQLNAGRVSETSYMDYSTLLLNTNPEFNRASGASSVAVTIDGLKGIELVADAKLSAGARAIKIYQLTLFEENAVYSMTGISYNATPSMIELFKGIAKTFSRTKK